MTPVLNNIRVLDIGRYVAGPYCASLLHSLGADVIRIERPEGGEDRFISPLAVNQDGTPMEGGLFYQTAYGKKSVTLNFGQPDGLEILRKLVATADIIVANLPPRALQKIGLDWETLSTNHPQIILVTQTGFGHTGPDSNKGGFDGVGQAMSGAMFLTGTPEQPIKAGAPYVDYSTACLSAFATLAALMERQKTGRGQHIQASLLGSALAVMNAHLIEQAVTQIGRVGTGNRVQTSAPSDVFATRDGHVLVHTVGNNLFKRWAEMVGQPDLASDPRFQSDQMRGDARDILCEIMATWCATKTTAEALEELERGGVPAGAVLTIQQALDNPQAHAMGLFTDVPITNQSGKYAPVIGLPLSFSDMATNAPSAPPMLGADNEGVYAEIGLDAASLADLKARGII